MKVSSRRVQMYFPEKEYAEAAREAKNMNISVSELVRRAVRAFLDARGGRNLSRRDAIWRIIGCCESRDGDLSVNHDAYLYGRGKGRR